MAYGKVVKGDLAHVIGELYVPRGEELDRAFEVADHLLRSGLVSPYDVFEGYFEENGTLTLRVVDRTDLKGTDEPSGKPARLTPKPSRARVLPCPSCGSFDPCWANECAHPEKGATGDRLDLSQHK